MKNEQKLRKPQINEIYRHFKGNLYKVITLATDSETGEEMVVYQALYGDYGIYVRSLAMFTEKLDKKKYPKADQKYRFEPAEQLIDLTRLENASKKPEADQDTQNVFKKPEVAEDTQNVSKKPEADQDMQNVSKKPETAQDTQAADTPGLDPLLEAFLEADSYRERLNILRGLEHRITQEMINTMAIVLDLNIPDGTLEKRYQDLENSILTLDKYECIRP